MVLRQDDNVLWFLPTTVVAAVTVDPLISPSSSSLSDPGRSTGNDMQSSATTKVKPTLSAAQHWPIVYGPMFEPFLPGSQRRRRPRQPRVSAAPPATRHDYVLQQQQQQLGCPNDLRGIRATSNPRSWDISLLENNSCSQSLTGDYEMYYEDMPLELLGNVFSSFMQISAESLARLAEERTLARNRARRPARMTTSTVDNSIPPHLRLRLQQHQIQRSQSRYSQDSSETTMHFTVNDSDTDSQTGSDGELESSTVSSQESEDSMPDNDDSNRSSSSSEDESQDIGMNFQSDSNSTISSYTTSDEDERPAGRGARGFTKGYDSFAQYECSCHPAIREATDQHSRPRLGINRVDNDMDEATMLYLIHRDQYFHPTTHTSLRSDLYRCSLVNRQWRLAALPLLWQSVVLDSESCRTEHIIRPCRRHRVDAEATQLSMTKTRLEVMLDSYLQIYGLDLAKCVKTVELDLRLLIWSADGESVRRILNRLSPFAHLRLIWAEKESAEEMATGFRTAMQGIHGHIRHLHFSPGFVFSKAWAQEMAIMTRLEHLTLERQSALETMGYNWGRIRHLTLHAAIPMNLLHFSSTVSTTSTDLTDVVPSIIASTSTSDHAQSSHIAGGSALVGDLLASTASNLSAVSNSTSHSHPTVHPQKSPIGWWQWASLETSRVSVASSSKP
ncbi:hypothetical protein EMPS_02393 [Entomortierella parvispora]|uniref:F-box domain-containing protein n=1 Tax=Entomortierella parvispora TaxID=205924 RepID=A0A9P3LTL0_9FUNG|nr:hypothetical protein EMPS_02393 [Entomortierella parvispora]